MTAKEKPVLITGGTGMIGSHLEKRLLSDGYPVRILSRSGDAVFRWDLNREFIDPAALENVDTIIHLAGTPISGRWTNSYKKEIRESRIKTANLLFKKIRESGHTPKTFITASGVNYYGTRTTEKVFTEADPPADDFLGKLSYEWEESALPFRDLSTRVCMVRTPVVLSPDGGMLKALLPMAKKHLVSPMGKGNQPVPWVHIEDLVRAYQFLMEEETLSGAFNVVASEKVSSKILTETLMQELGKSMILPHVPAFLLRLALGEMADLLLEGFSVSNKKIQDTGFTFQFDKLQPALRDLLS